MMIVVAAVLHQHHHLHRKRKERQGEMVVARLDPRAPAPGWYGGALLSSRDSDGCAPTSNPIDPICCSMFVRVYTGCTCRIRVVFVAYYSSIITISNKTNDRRTIPRLLSRSVERLAVASSECGAETQPRPETGCRRRRRAHGRVLLIQGIQKDGFEQG